MITSDQMNAIRAVGAAFFTDDVSIRHRLDFSQESSTDSDSAFGEADFGDDVVLYDRRPTLVKGWMTTTPTVAFSEDASQIITANTLVLRLPVGTPVKNGDEITVRGGVFECVDVTDEATWPEWLKVALRRIQ